MNLYHTAQLAKLENHVDHETGEIDIIAFDNSQIALKEKQQAVVCFIKNRSANIKLLDNAIQELQDKKKAIQSQTDKLSEYLLAHMQEHGITEIEAQDLTFSAKIKNNPPAVHIIGDVPNEYMRTPKPPAPSPDKAAIKKALKDGVALDFAKLEASQRLDIQ